jgi:hypothetical protein
MAGTGAAMTNGCGNSRTFRRLVLRIEILLISTRIRDDGTLETKWKCQIVSRLPVRPVPIDDVSS